METVGMGLMIQYEDRATAGLYQTEEAFNRVNKGAEELVNNMNGQMNSVQDLSTQFMSQIYAGEKLMNNGERVLDFYSNFGNQIIATGDDFEKTRITLEALYKSSEVAEEKMRWAMGYASKTPFDITDIKGALVGMKAVGIEVDKQVTSMSGYKQEFMSYIGDLSALRPDVGMGRVTYAIRNALGGNIRSLQAALDINVEQMLGRKFNAQNAQQDIADLVSAMGAEGLMEKLNGTWSQMLSNMGDQATRFWLAISDAGAFDEAKGMLKSISDTIANIDDEEMKKIGENISSVVVTLLTPLKMLISVGTKAFNWVKTLVKEHPILLKVLSVLPAIVGVILALTGGMLVLNGTLGVAKMFLLGLPKLVGTFAKTIGLATTGSVALSTSLGFILFKFAKLIAISYLIKKAWEMDFLGIQTLTTRLFNNIKDSSQRVFRIMKMDAKSYVFEVQRLFDKADFWSLMSAKALEYIAVIKGIGDAWGDNTLSQENYDILEGLGLLSVIEDVLNFKFRFSQFWEGFKKGIDESTEKVINFFDKMEIRLKPAMDLMDKLFGNKESSSNGLLGNPSQYAEIGEKVADIAVSVFGILALSKVIGIISTIMKVLAPLGTFLGGVLISIGAILGLPASVVAVIIVAVGLLIAFIVKNAEEIKTFILGIGKAVENFWIKVNDTISELFRGVYESFIPLINLVNGLFGKKKIEVDYVETRSVNGPNAPVSYAKPEKYDRRSKAIGASTGGYTRDEGLLYLHPDELIVNGKMTQMLGDFLVANNNNPTSIGKTSNDLLEARNDISRVPVTEVYQDNSINVEKGAIEVTMQNGSEEEIDSLADKLWEKLRKKREVDNARKYKPQNA